MMDSPNAHPRKPDDAGRTAQVDGRHSCPSVARRNAWNCGRQYDVSHRPVSGLASDAVGIGLIAFPCIAQWLMIRFGLPTVAGAAPAWLKSAAMDGRFLILAIRIDRKNNAPASRFTRPRGGQGTCGGAQCRACAAVRHKRGCTIRRDRVRRRCRSRNPRDQLAIVANAKAHFDRSAAHRAILDIRL